MQTFSSPGDKPEKSITRVHFVWANPRLKTTFSKDHKGGSSNQALFFSQTLNLTLVPQELISFNFLSTCAKNIRVEACFCPKFHFLCSSAC